jgi:hypothetical protein
MLTSTNSGRKEKERREEKRKDKKRKRKRKTAADSLPRLKTCSFPVPAQIVITTATCSVPCLSHAIS